jgi:hypothetical protein
MLANLNNQYSSVNEDYRVNVTYGEEKAIP